MVILPLSSAFFNLHLGSAAYQQSVLVSWCEGISWGYNDSLQTVVWQSRCDRCSQWLLPRPPSATTALVKKFQAVSVASDLESLRCAFEQLEIRVWLKTCIHSIATGSWSRRACSSYNTLSSFLLLYHPTISHNDFPSNRLCLYAVSMQLRAYNSPIFVYLFSSSFLTEYGLRHLFINSFEWGKESVSVSRTYSTSEFTTSCILVSELREFVRTAQTSMSNIQLAMIVGLNIILKYSSLRFTQNCCEAVKQIRHLFSLYYLIIKLHLLPCKHSTYLMCNQLISKS